MKKFLGILVLILFTLQAPSWADDIRDFQIEGISIGDSALEYYTESKINSYEKEYYKNKKFFKITIHTKKSTYDTLGLTFKSKDKKYIMHGINGALTLDNIKSCHKKQNEIKKELDEIFISNAKKDTGKHPGYKDSTYIRYTYYLSDGAQAEVICYDMSKKLEKKGKWDSLYVSLASVEYKKFLTHEAYK